MKTLITIKVVPQDAEDLQQYNIPAYLNALRDHIEEHIFDCEVRAIIDFGEIKKGEPPVLIQPDEEIAPFSENDTDAAL